MKVSLLIFILGILTAGLVVAGKDGALPSRTFTTAEAGFNFAYSNDQLTARAIGDRSIDLLGLFDSADGGQSSRYSVKLDVENEDRDWSFEVTLTVDF